MKVENMQKLNELANEIHELDIFIHVAGCVWTGKVTLKKLVSNAFGFFRSEEFNMNTEIKSRVLKVLKDYQAELSQKFEEITDGR